MKITPSLRKKCPYSEFNSGPYFPAFGLNTERYGVLSPNVGKYRPEKTPYLDTFHAVGIGTIYGLMVEIRGKIHLKFT